MRLTKTERILKKKELKTIPLSIEDRTYISLGLKSLQKEYEGRSSPVLQQYAKEVKALRKHLDKVI
jgi:hypothetical protein